jgi:hypothetical protein
MVERASAAPQKRLFLELLTRDITLEDAVLDLIDNSINSVLVSEHVDLEARFDDVISGEADLSRFDHYRIEISFDAEQFSLRDNCGGITYDAGKNHVFNFGRSGPPSSADTLSVYGIGLKRALFKLGNRISVVSHADVPFAVAFDAAKWAEKDDWTVPLRSLPGGRVEGASTCIRVRQLAADTRERIGAPDFAGSLAQRIRETYCFFINRFCTIWVNGDRVDGDPIQVGAEDTLTPAVQRIEEGSVSAIIVAGLAPKRGDKWLTPDAGWYIFCNGRAVVFADRTRLTGWERGLPQYVSKFRGFRGIVFFFSKNPELLPWTTTKTDINEESVIYQRALTIMYTTARPVLSFLSSLYGADEVESEPAKAAAEAVSSANLTRVVSLQASSFHPPTKRAPTSLTVQFRVPIDDINRVKAHLGNPGLSARRIGEIAFKYYLENEVV